MESKQNRIFIYVGASVLAFLVIVYFFWVRPNQQLNEAKASLNLKDFIELKSGIRSGLAQALGGAALLIGLGFTWRSIKAAEKNLTIAQENIRATQETATKNLTIALEGQITERFTKAIELLSNETSVAARLGAIYALERIARDSGKDHWTIMEILSAYVREKAHWVPAEVAIPETAEDALRVIPPPAIDVRACLSVISRRNRSGEKGDQRLNLMKVDLRRCHLDSPHFEKAKIGQSRLDWALLIGAHLEGAFLFRTHLERAFLIRANFDGADLEQAHLEGADLTDAHFKKSVLTETNFDKAVLVRTHFEGTDLRAATGLTQQQIVEAVFDEHTLLPDGLVRPEPPKN
ncbi:MAG TPA: pentapeptide repeat-containing protein [Pyrinomonadaceae bacterium]|nr:pentapeptide repeat-containing protein [Pyrinomonadaceae bacterium]